MSTKIEWVRNPDGTAGETWNPISGCSKVSRGCERCYAERMDRRQMMPGRKDGFRPWTAQNAEYNVRLHPERLEQPLHWRKSRRVFVNSMSDLFHERVPDEFIDQVFAVMALAPQHTFQILTKREKRMAGYFAGIESDSQWHGRLHVCAAPIIPDDYDERWVDFLSDPIWPLPNVHLLFSAEDQKTFDERVRWVLQTPAAVRGVSLEPLLGPIILDDVGGGGHTALTTEIDHPEDTKLDWVIVGGESGPGARPMNPDWVRSIRDQCQAAGVSFFFKQWGEWAPFADNGPLPKHCSYVGIDGSVRVGDFEDDADWCMGHVGKKAAGRVLDGRTWDEFPEVK